MKASESAKKKMYELLSEKLPKNSVEYAFGLWVKQPFSFTIARTRSTCLGNYSYRNHHHKITVNHDLNPYQFLITYVHEVAHQHVFVDYYLAKKRRVLPHGDEWKAAFQILMQPLLTPDVFPPEILSVLQVHMLNPAASTVRDMTLQKVIKVFDDKETSNDNELHLEELKEGEWFVFNRRIFQKLETRRTRVMCLEKTSKRKFTISKMAVVERVS